MHGDCALVCTRIDVDDETIMLSSTAVPIYSCIVCNSDVPTAAQRRVINPRNERSAVVHDFFVNIVSSGYKFESSSVSYLRRVPCFSNLQKVVKHHDALKELLVSLCANLLVPQSPAVQNEPTFDDRGEGVSETPSIS